MSCKLDSTLFNGRPWLEQRPDPASINVIMALAPVVGIVASRHACRVFSSSALCFSILFSPLFSSPFWHLSIFITFASFLSIPCDQGVCLRTFLPSLLTCKKKSRPTASVKAKSLLLCVLYFIDLVLLKTSKLYKSFNRRVEIKDLDI